MRVEAYIRSTDTVTANGAAGAACIEPPEIDYRQHHVEIFVVYEFGDTLSELFSDIGDALDEALDNADCGKRDHEVEIDEHNFDVLSSLMLRDVAEFRNDKTARGAIRYEGTATDNESCGGRGGVYDRIR